MHLYAPYLIAVTAIARLCAAAGTMQLAWTTDLWGSFEFANGTFGPDGPWQALAV